METQVKILRDELSGLLNNDRIILSKEILRISEEMDKLTVSLLMEQIENEFKVGAMTINDDMSDIYSR